MPRRWRIAPGNGAGAPPRAEPLPIWYPQGLISAAPAGTNWIYSTTGAVHLVTGTDGAAGSHREVKLPGGFVHVSPDGQWLAMVYAYSSRMRVYRLPALEEVATLQASNFVRFVRFSPASDEMLVITRDGFEWYTPGPWTRFRFQPSNPVSGAYGLYTPDGAGLWMVANYRNASLYDRRTLEPVLSLPNDVLPLAVSADGNLLAVTVGGRQVRVWDLPAVRRQLAALGLDW